jgi:co-chaperonin GroES (HSP10)
MSTEKTPKALKGRVIIEPASYDEEKTITTYTGESVDLYVRKRPPVEGKIVSIGDDVEADVKVGDTVLFEMHAGSQFDYNGRHFYNYYEDMLLGVKENESTNVEQDMF